MKKRMSFVLLILLALGFHIPVLLSAIKVESSYFKGKSFDDYYFFIGDRTYYLAGAKSLYEFDIVSKFNDKKQPLLGQNRPIQPGDMPWYAKYALIAYPYPAFKFGYSITAALLTAIFPARYFDYFIPRLVLTNLILTLLSMLLIYLIIRRWIANAVGALMGASFFIFDSWLAYTSYSYQSHTIAGIFFMLLGFYWFIKKKEIDVIDLGIITFLLTFSVFTSSHIIPLALAMEVFILIHVFFRIRGIKLLWFAISSGIGAAIIPMYIFGMESFFQFNDLGIPRLFTQLRFYNSVVSKIIADFPLYARFIYDIRLYNLFAIPIAALLIFMRLYQNRNKSHIEGMKPELEHPARLVHLPSYRLLLLSTATGFLISISYGIPLVRSQVPYTVLFGILLGAGFGRMYSKGPKVIKMICLAVVILLVFNFYFMNQVIKISNDKSSVCGVSLNDISICQMGLKMFIDKYDPFLKGRQDCYLRFDGMDLVLPYTGTRGFSREMRTRELVTEETFENDFRLINDIFSLEEKGLLKKGDIERKTKYLWDVGLWDNEYNFLYGYLYQVNRYLKDMPIKNIDTHSSYYIQYASLKRAVRDIFPDSSLSDEDTKQYGEFIILRPKQISLSSINRISEGKNRLIDGDPDTYWHVRNPRTTFIDWIKLDLEEKRNVITLRILPRGDDIQLWKKDNAVWEGSQDGQEWKMLSRLTLEDKVIGKGVWIIFKLPEGEAFRYYRLRIEDPSFFSLAELEIYGKYGKNK